MERTGTSQLAARVEEVGDRVIAVLHRIDDALANLTAVDGNAVDRVELERPGAHAASRAALQGTTIAHRRSPRSEWLPLVVALAGIAGAAVATRAWQRR